MPLNVAMWLELFHAAALEARNRVFLFGFTQEFQEPLGQLPPEERNAEAVKNKVCELIKPVLSRIGVDVEGSLGSHSVRKFGSAPPPPPARIGVTTRRGTTARS